MAKKGNGLRSLIKRHTTSMVRAFAEQANAMRGMQHKPSQGQFCELFVSTLLSKYLPHQFGVGSGIVVNPVGTESPQTDVIVYDRRILPPFISEATLGVFPAESVVASIEVKTELNRTSFMQAEEKAKSLMDVYSHEAFPNTIPPPVPMPWLFAISGSGGQELGDAKKGAEFLDEHIKTLIGICVLNKYSWIKINNNWAIRQPNKFGEETKRFLAILADNTRSYADSRLRILMKKHQDWLGAYTRDND